MLNGPASSFPTQVHGPATHSTDMSAMHDLRPVEVAQAVYQATRAEMVLVFGARARGDYGPDSDIDLLVLIDHMPQLDEMYAQASDAAFPVMRTLYEPPVNVEFVVMGLADFHRDRAAPNHVAGQAYRDGVTMRGEPPPYRPVEPDYWPDIKERFSAAARSLWDLEVTIKGGATQEAVDFHAQQTVENLLKGWISALGARYRNEHDIKALAAIVSQHSGASAAETGAGLSWLTAYAVDYRYKGVVVTMLDRPGLLREVSQLHSAVRDRVVALTSRRDLPA